MTDLSKRTTPESDAEALRCSGNTDDDDEGQAVVGIRFARSLEQRLGAAVEKLEKASETLRAADGDGFTPISVTEREQLWWDIDETLAAIKEAK